jgi:ABC-type sugar transport system ATPase subunit
MSEPILRMQGITKFIYGSDGKPVRGSDVKILDAVDFDLRAGEVHILIGENGAGKSTLMKVLGGILPPDRGEVLLDGAAVSFASPRHARAHGIAFIHQELNLCPNLDVAHNIFLGREPVRRGIRDRKAMVERSEALLRTLGYQIDPRVKVARLSTAQQQVVEIAKALSYDSRILIMDEPTASLTKREIDVLFELIRKMRARGMGIIYISHRFEEFDQVGDRVSVLRDGRSVGSLPMSDFDPGAVIQLMVGRRIEEMYPHTHRPGQEVVLDVRGLRLGTRTPPVDLVVRKGEVVGIGGLVGSGRTELAKSVFGARPFAGGEVRYLGRDIRGRRPARLIEEGMAYLSEDRKTEGLVLAMNIRENVTLPVLSRLATLGLISPRRERAEARRILTELNVVARSTEQGIATLSGGNQQRCVLGKWLATRPRLLMLDEPTRGVDVNAKAEIHRMIDEIAGAGVAVLMISSELPELVGMSDRIYVMRDGGVAAEIADRASMTQERIVDLICQQEPGVGAPAARALRPS